MDVFIVVRRCIDEYNVTIELKSGDVLMFSRYYNDNKEAVSLAKKLKAMQIKFHSFKYKKLNERDFAFGLLDENGEQMLFSITYPSAEVALSMAQLISDRACDAKIVQ